MAWRTAVRSLRAAATQPPRPEAGAELSSTWPPGSVVEPAPARERPGLVQAGEGGGHSPLVHGESRVTAVTDQPFQLYPDPSGRAGLEGDPVRLRLRVVFRKRWARRAGSIAALRGHRLPRPCRLRQARSRKPRLRRCNSTLSYPEAPDRCSPGGGGGMTAHEVDVVVIGMGVGGEEVAERLAAAGLDVIGVENPGRRRVPLLGLRPDQDDGPGRPGARRGAPDPRPRRGVHRDAGLGAGRPAHP